MTQDKVVAKQAGLSRRRFLHFSTLACGGVLIACGGGGASNARAQSPAPGQVSSTSANDGAALGDFMRIGADNRISVYVGASEMGQGALTVMPMMLAEELDADWSLVSAEHSPVAAAFNNPYFFKAVQFSVASTCTRGYFEEQRRAGAAIRDMLCSAAAQRWGVSKSSLRTENSYVYHDDSGRYASYGELASEAASQPEPLVPSLKSPAEFKIIGTDRQRLDVAAKTDGTMVYGMDVDLPNMLTAVIARPPRFHGIALNYDANAALAVAGVQEVFTVPAGIAVVADSFWAAEKGRKALETHWSQLAGDRTDSSALRNEYQLKLNVRGIPARVDGSVTFAKFLAADNVDADFHFPHMAHAAMEPLNVVVDYDGQQADIWTGSQSPTLDKAAAAFVLGVPPSRINFHNLPSGGAFGRRGNPFADFVQDACQVARRVQQPVKVVWTREDDMKGGFYRPASAVRVAASVDRSGGISAWQHRAITQDLTAIQYGEEFIDHIHQAELPDFDKLTDFDTGMPYDIDNVLVDFHLKVNPALPALWMRSVNKFTDVFAQECFIDELAGRQSADPYQFRRSMLASNDRYRTVLDRAAQAANWGNVASDRFQGIAVMGHWQSCIAQVVEISVSNDREIRIHKITSAVDCGTAVNPDLVVAQIESGIVYALSSVLFGDIELRDGVVQQSNFDDYPVLRLHQCPQMETHIVSSSGDPGGVGELGVPAVGPALANALLAATGDSVRQLPICKHYNYQVI